MFLKGDLNTFNTWLLEYGVTNVYCDTIFLQVALAYTVYLLLCTDNVYYGMLYLFLLIFYFGLLMSLLQLELFTGFLWVTELTVLFIFLLLCFYLNTAGTFTAVRRTYFFLLALLISTATTAYSVRENANLAVFNYVDLWDDFYEAHDNAAMTDLYGLFISYYVFNTPYTIIIFILLFLCSVVSVNLNKSTTLFKKENVGSYLSILNFFKKMTNFVFYRRQNLSRQTLRRPATKMFKRK